MKEAEGGDVSALSALKERLPEEIDTFLLEEYGQLGQTAENALIKAVARGTSCKPSTRAESKSGCIGVQLGVGGNYYKHNMLYPSILSK